MNKQCVGVIAEMEEVELLPHQTQLEDCDQVEHQSIDTLTNVKDLSSSYDQPLLIRTASDENNRDQQLTGQHDFCDDEQFEVEAEQSFTHLSTQFECAICLEQTALADSFKLTACGHTYCLQVRICIDLCNN